MKDRFNWAIIGCGDNVREAADEIIEILAKNQIKLYEFEIVFEIVSKNISKQVVQKAE